MAILRLSARIWTALLGITLVVVAGGLAARWLLPAGWSADAPVVVAAMPLHGTDDVPLRSEIRLRFNQAMNRSSVERALHFTPPISGRFQWEDGRRELVFYPDEQLTADITYTIQLEATALGRLFLPLTAPFSLSFHTAPAPVVLAALPGDTSVPITSSIALVFSRPMVSVELLHRPITIPQLQFQPPVAGEARWIDQTTLLFVPTQPLQPATTIRGSLDGTLTDLNGTPLGQPFGWTFGTTAPLLRRNDPPPGARDVGPNDPLLLEISQPLAEDEIERGLTITPPISVSITTAVSGTGQLVTVVPTGGWQPSTTYDIQLGALRPFVGDRPLAPNRWSFTTAPPFTLVGRFPGQGQILPNGQSVRLIFASAVNTDTLLAGLRLEPDAGPLQIVGNGAEVRIQAELRANTTYTLTLNQTIADLHGTTLDRAYQLNFVTAPALPMLAVPDAVRRFLRVPADEVATVRVQRTNISALDMELYQLDEATLLRVFGFTTINWQDFQPGRYNLQPLRSWRVVLDGDPAGQVAESTLPVSVQDPPAPLPPGAYYLRMRSSEGPGADLVLVVSRATLTLVTGSNQSLVWAESAGTPLPNVALALYAGNSVVRRGTTDANGLWLIDWPTNGGTYLVVAASGQPVDAPGAGAIVGSEWSLPGGSSVGRERSDYRIGVTTDRSSYQPGELVRIGGFVRAIKNGQIDAPTENTPVDVSLRRVGTTDSITTTSLRLATNGVVSTTLPLGNIQAGDYLLRFVVGATVRDLPFEVREKAEPPFNVAIVRSDEQSTTVEATTRNGQPIGGASVRWHIEGGSIADMPPTELAGYTVGDDEEPLGQIIDQYGSGTTDANGQLSIALPNTAITQTTQLHIRAEVNEPGGPTAVGTTKVTLLPNDLFIGIRPEAQVFVAPSKPEIELLAVQRDGTPGARTSLQVDVLRRTWQPSFTETRVSRRIVESDEQGRATVTLDLRAGDEYRLVVTGRDGAQRLARTVRSIWIAPGAEANSGWQPITGGLLVVPDQQTYLPGATANLLLGLSQPTARLLVAVERNGVLTATVRTAQANQLLPVPIPGGGEGDATVTILAQNGDTSSVGRIVLPVQSTIAPLDVRIAARLESGTGIDALSQTALVSVTVRDANGTPVSGDLLVAVSESHELPLAAVDPGVVTRPPRVAPPVLARTSAIEPQSASSPRGAERSPLLTPRSSPRNDYSTRFWRSGIRTLPDGTAQLEVSLSPGIAEWRVSVIASGGATLFGQGSTFITTTQPLTVTPVVSSPLVQGDTTSVGLSAENTSDQPITVTAALTTTLALNEPLTRTVQLAARQRQLLSWSAVAHTSGTTILTWTVQTDGIISVVTSTMELLPPAIKGESETLVGPLRFSRPITTSATQQPMALEIAVAPSYPAAISRSQQWLAAQPARSIEQEASLLALSALLLRTDGISNSVSLQQTVEDAQTALVAQQQADGGWGWWPRTPSHPFVTAYVLETWSTAELDLAPDVRTDAITYLQQELRHTTDADLQAYLLYVLSLYGEDQSAAVRSLVQQAALHPLGVDGLAFVALTLPESEVNDVLEQLAALAQRSGVSPETSATLFWSDDSASDVPGSAVSSTALVVRAFERGRRDSPLLPQARRWLARAWGVDGWPTAYDSARAAETLQQVSAPLLPGTSSISATATLYGRPLPLQTATLTSATVLDIPLTGGDTALSVELTGSEDAELPLLTYRLTYSIPVSPTGGAPGLAITRDYRDPVSGDLLDLTSLRSGQLVRVQLTLVVATTQTFVTLRESRTAVLATIQPQPSNPFIHIVTGNELRWSATRLAPGVYVQSYLARVGLPGEYALPPASSQGIYSSLPPARGPAQRAVVK